MDYVSYATLKRLKASMVGVYLFIAVCLGLSCCYIGIPFLIYGIYIYCLTKKVICELEREYKYFGLRDDAGSMAGSSEAEGRFRADFERARKGGMRADRMSEEQWLREYAPLLRYFYGQGAIDYLKKMRMAEMVKQQDSTEEELRQQQELFQQQQLMFQQQQQQNQLQQEAWQQQMEWAQLQQQDMLLQQQQMFQQQQDMFR